MWLAGKPPSSLTDANGTLNPDGRYAVLAVPAPSTVTWTLRRGLEVRRRSATPAHQIASIELPLAGYEPGVYQLEARLDDKVGGDSRILEFEIRSGEARKSSSPLWFRSTRI